MADEQQAEQDEKQADPKEPSVLGQSVQEVVLVCGVFLLLGAGLGWLVKIVAKWIVGLPWAPMQGPAELVTSVPEPGLTIGMICLGAVVGLGLGILARHEELRVEVAGTGVTLMRKSDSEVVPARDVALTCMDGKQLVLFGHNGEELAREKTDIGRERMAETLRAHGYAWADQDPHADAFRPWVPDLPNLPPEANALLRARGKVLEKHGPDHDEARELRTELGRAGVVVRDEKKRQYVRVVGSAS